MAQLSFPDPDESASDGVLYKVDPQAYLQLNWPELAQQLQQAQQQAVAQQQQQEQAAAQQQMQQQGAQAGQQLQQKEQAHQQKMSHSEQAFQQKQEQAAQPPTTAAPASSASLKNVPLPKK